MSKYRGLKCGEMEHIRDSSKKPFDHLPISTLTQLLCTAAERADLKVAKQLIEANANIYDLKVMESACDIYTVQFLLQHSAKMPCNNMLITAIQNYDIDMVSLLLKHKMNIRTNSPLQRFVETYHMKDYPIEDTVQMIKLLIDNGADIEAPIKASIILTVDIKILELLLNNGMPVTYNMIKQAYTRGDIDIIKLLQLHWKDKYIDIGITHFSYHTYKSPRVIEYYIHMYNPPQFTKNRMLQVACEFQIPEPIELLLEWGARLENAESTYETVLRANRQVRIKILQHLLQYIPRDKLAHTRDFNMIVGKDIPLAKLFVQYPLTEPILTFQARHYLEHTRINTLLLGTQPRAGINSSVQRMIRHPLAEKYILRFVIGYLIDV